MYIIVGTTEDNVMKVPAGEQEGRSIFLPTPENSGDPSIS